jgi:hypothetical protein
MLLLPPPLRFHDSSSSLENFSGRLQRQFLTILSFLKCSTALMMEDDGGVFDGS